MLNQTICFRCNNVTKQGGTFLATTNRWKRARCVSPTHIIFFTFALCSIFGMTAKRMRVCVLEIVRKEFTQIRPKKKSCVCVQRNDVEAFGSSKKIIYVYSLVFCRSLLTIISHTHTPWRVFFHSTPGFYSTHKSVLCLHGINSIPGNKFTRQCMFIINGIPIHLFDDWKQLYSYEFLHGWHLP